MWTIFRREFTQYFTSPVAYMIAAAFFLVTGLLFTSDITLSVGVKSPDAALVPAYLSFFLIFFAPVLTMRMLAEETREGTLELLLTAPVSDVGIVVGKFLAAWAFYSLLLGATLVYQVILIVVQATPDLSHALAAYIGIWLYGGATLAVGLFFSAITENQILAAFLSIAALTILWLGDLAGEIVASIDLAQILRQLSLAGHFSSSFAAGLLRAEDVAFYAGIIVIMLFVTIRAVAARRLQ